MRINVRVIRSIVAPIIRIAWHAAGYIKANFPIEITITGYVQYLGSKGKRGGICDGGADGCRARGCVCYGHGIGAHSKARAVLGGCTARPCVGVWGRTSTHGEVNSPAVGVGATHLGNDSTEHGLGAAYTDTHFRHFHFVNGHDLGVCIGENADPDPQGTATRYAAVIDHNIVRKRRARCPKGVRHCRTCVASLHIGYHGICTAIHTI